MGRTEVRNRQLYDNSWRLHYPTLNNGIEQPDKQKN